VELRLWCLDLRYLLIAHFDRPQSRGNIVW
jgi:hypothetical protein